MKRLLLFVSAVLLTSVSMADNQQTVVVGGQPVDKTVKQITFHGDQVVLTYTDESTQAEDMSLVKLTFTYGGPTGIDHQLVSLPSVMQGKVYNLNGQQMGSSTNGLSKGVYVVNGKKVIVK